MEIILFREKFFDWSDIFRFIKVKSLDVGSKVDMRRIDNCCCISYFISVFFIEFLCKIKIEL